MHIETAPHAVTCEPGVTDLTREQLLHLLAEASEFEHNLLCCYLYVIQGEGSPADADDSHFQRFSLIKTELDAFTRENPDSRR